MPDETAVGLVRRGRPGCAPLFTLGQWRDFTVEHIAPQSEDGGREWNRDIYEETRTIHTLGNLTLLPKMENVVIGARSWEIKRLHVCVSSGERRRSSTRERRSWRERVEN